MVRAESCQFPEVAPPLPRGPVTSALASLWIMRYLEPELPQGPALEVGGTFRVALRDSSGARWTYQTFGYATRKAGEPPDTAPVMVVYDLADSVLEVRTTVEGRKVGIGLRLRAARSPAPGTEFIPFIENLAKNDKLARARIEVVDRKGKVVHSKEGDLRQFGFT